MYVCMCVEPVKCTVVFAAACIFMCATANRSEMRGIFLVQHVAYVMLWVFRIFSAHVV